MNVTVWSKISKLHRDHKFEYCVSTNMKEDGRLMYKNSDYEEILLKYNALLPALSLRKTTSKDESDCLEQKIEATP